MHFSSNFFLAEIGFFSLVGLPYTWKFLWAPMMDRFSLPFLGRRRGWMLLTQLALMLSMITLGFIQPQLSVWTVAYLAAVVAFFSAILSAYFLGDSFLKEVSSIFAANIL